jgi:broad specificity phosphatase PhoE
VRLLLIRHGQTPSNVAGAIDTAFPGAGLTELGQAQAAAVPDALAGEDLAAVYASRLVRTQLTATPLVTARDLDLQVLDGLHEVSAGDLEMRTDEEAVQAYAGCVAAWMRGDLARRMPGGETGDEFLARYRTAVQSATAAHADGDTVAVVSHGAAIRTFTALATGLDPEVSTELRIANTGMAVLEGDPASGWTLAHWSTEPLGGAQLTDARAHDVTGESADDAAEEG